MLKGTPVRSERISTICSDAGDLVGKGPAVSLGETTQSSLELPEPSGVISSVKESFRQELAKGTMMATPRAAMPFFKKSLRCIFVDFKVLGDECVV